MPPKKKAAPKAAKTQTAKKPVARHHAARAMVDVENVNHPGQTARVDAAKYKRARAALLTVLPKKEPGLTQSEMAVAMRAALSEKDLPGTTSSWWMKSVQLDLEAKGLVVRDGGKPLRWRRA
jgi:hypothetical protein